MHPMMFLKLAALVGAWMVFGYLALVAVGALVLLWLLLASEPDWS
jgi:hypothetical protein